VKNIYSRSMLLCFALVFSLSCGEGEELLWPEDSVDSAPGVEVPGSEEVAMPQEDEGAWKGEEDWGDEDAEGEEAWVPEVAAAATTARNGVCDSGEFCYFYNSDNLGAISDFSASVGDYGSTQPSCYDFKPRPNNINDTKLNNGKGTCIKNNAASACNFSDRTVRVYYNSNYAGSLFQDILSGKCANLSASLKNNNASHQFVNSSSEPPPSPGLSWQYPMSNYYISLGWGGINSKKLADRNRHVAIDIVGSIGGSVNAAAAGTVAAVGSQNANGNFVVLQHNLNGNTVYSFYAHLSSYSVSRGAVVSKGQKIGVMGDTPSASLPPEQRFGAHLHFSVMNKLDSTGAYYGYASAASFSGNRATYLGTTFYNPAYVIQYEKLP